MEFDIPKWLVDASQIVGAFATATAVVVSLQLARRSERQRPKIFLGVRQHITVGPEPGVTLDYEIAIGIVNAGTLPFTVRFASLLLHDTKGRRIWAHGLGAGYRGALPARLDHAQDVDLTIKVTDWQNWSRGMSSRGWLRRQRPAVTMMTSLGTNFKMYMSREDYKTLKRAVDAGFAGRASA
jgi:hypothetical protein